MHLTLDLKAFSFRLNHAIRTSKGVLCKKKGWLLHLESPSGNCGWGEISPLDNSELTSCEKVLTKIGTSPSRQELENGLFHWPRSLAFGVGAALAEIDGLVGDKINRGWLKPPTSAFLLPSNQSLLNTIDLLVKEQTKSEHPLTLKWKVAIKPQADEEVTLHKILQKLPKNARLRIDSNAGWNRNQAKQWASYLCNEPRLDWFEQPLPANDLEGLLELAKQVPIALDESLLLDPSLYTSWHHWQIRRPLLEGDPRVLLKELNQKIGYRAISTTFETGIGRRWVNHLAALQQQGPTPTAPGLAPGWSPEGKLFSTDPNEVWEAA